MMQMQKQKQVSAQRLFLYVVHSSMDVQGLGCVEIQGVHRYKDVAVYIVYRYRVCMDINWAQV
jgi:hypothetical protein